MLPSNEVMKKRIVVFTSKGGGGHISAAHAINDALDHEQFDVEIINIFEDVLLPLDPIRFFSGGLLSGEILYNICLTRNWIWCANQVCNLGRTAGPLLTHPMKYLIEKFIKVSRPDLVISVVPMTNGVLARVTEKHGIPFLLIPTDLDVASFTFDLTPPYANNMKVALAFDDYDHAQKGIKKGLDDSLVVGGFPVKAAFSEDKNREALKDDFSVPHDKKVLLLMMGAAGSHRISDYLKALVTYSAPLHIIVCIGRNERLRDVISRISFPGYITLTVMGTTKRVADLMALSDLCIIKSGSVSVCEALHAHLPMLLDGTGTLLKWEKFNLEFIPGHGFGDVIASFDQVNTMVAKYLNDETLVNECKNKMRSYPKKNFSKTVGTLINSMFASQET